jgi:hypothetical protein
MEMISTRQGYVLKIFVDERSTSLKYSDNIQPKI